MRQISWCIFLLFMLVLPARLTAQISESQDVASIEFVKDSVFLNPEVLYFNVIKIQNRTTVVQKIRLQVVLPEGWKPMTSVPSLLEIQPGKTKPVPLRVTIPKTTPAGKPYSIAAAILTEENKALDKSETFIAMEAHRNWSLEADESTVYFKPEEVTAPFSISIENKGNIMEEYRLHYELSDELKLPSGAKKPPGRISVPAQSDTTLNLEVNCNRYYLVTPFSDATVSLTASTDQIENSSRIKFVRLPGDYDNLSNAKILPLNIAGLQTRMYNSLDIPMTTAFLRGRIPVKKEQFLVYRFYSRDIFNITDFWSDNDVELYYTTPSFEGGIGSSSSHLGKNLFIRNSVYGDLELGIGEYNNLYAFANKGLLDKSLGYALGHELNLEKFSIMNSASNSYNAIINSTTQSLRNSTSLAFAPGNSIDYEGLYYVSETESADDVNSDNYEHRFSYRGKITDFVTIGASNEYRYIDTDVSRLLTNSSRASTGVRVGRSGFVISGIYAYNHKEVATKGEDITDLIILRHQGTAQLTLPSIRRTRLILGTVYTTLQQDTYGENTWLSTEYDAFIKASMYSTRMQYRAKLQMGIRDAVMSGYSIDRNFHKLATATVTRKLGLNSDLSLNLNYSDGVIVGTNYTRSLEESFNASAAYKQSLYKQMLALNLSAGYSYSSLQNDALSVNAALEGKLKNSLDLKLKSTFKSNTNSVLSFTSIEASVIKGFDIGRKKANYHDIVVICFKDLNGNGKHDPKEPGAENVQVSLKLIQEDHSFEQAGQRVRFKNTALLTGKSGSVTCSYMPAGDYELQLLPLSDMQGFFNFSGSLQNINLNKNKRHYVPYIQAARIVGMVDIQKSNFSQTGTMDIANIRVTAVDDQGNEYTVLTDKMGYYTLYVPRNREYTISINNIIGSKFQLEKNNIPVSMKNQDKAEINFIFKEKKRRINFSRG